MDHQYSIYDYMTPEYNGTKDEILMFHAERQLENKIKLIECCGTRPVGKFISDHEYWIECSICKQKTKKHKKYYQAMQAWNREEREK